VSGSEREGEGPASEVPPAPPPPPDPDPAASVPPDPVPSVPPPPPFPLDVPRRLDPRVRSAWLVSGLIRAAFLGGVAALLELSVLRTKPWWPLPPGVATMATAAFFLLLAVVFPRLDYAAWRYVLRGHDLLLHFGVVWKVQRSVPRVRIQHVDIRSGPLDRLFGLVHLVLYTAGGGEADARIPGLRSQDAEALREVLLQTEAGHAAD
jgi:membrane protein YdbS with pleckstrin-like domain